MENLKQEEIIKLKTISEFLFYDIYEYCVSYPRFEKCFLPLFNNIKINLFKVFTEIAGELKKYITYKRLLKAYLKYKEKEFQKDINSDLYIFFKTLFNKIMKGTNSYIGKHEDFSINNSHITLCFSTKNANNSFISKITVLNDGKNIIRGLIIEYNNIKKYELYAKELDNKLNKGLELHLDIINKNDFEKKKNHYENIDISLYHDSITHIFGTINKTNNIISSLGFKCISGKIESIGISDGDSFLFGEFGTKFHNLKFEIKEEGISLFEPKFIENKRKNFYLNNDKEIENEDIILDEDFLKNLKGDENKINQFIKTSFFEDNLLDNNESNEDISENNCIENIKIKNKNNENHTSADNFKIINSLKINEENPQEIKKSVENNRKLLKNDISGIENNNQINKEKKSSLPSLSLKKRNFKDLKEKLAKSIYKQFYNKYKYNSIIPAIILNEVVPDEINEREKDEEEEEMIEKIKLIKING